MEDVLDRPVISNILLDEPILEGRLAAKGSGLGLAPTIPVGMRAVTVRVNDVAGVAGFVLPGMRVDVLVTGRPPHWRGRHDVDRSAEHAGAVGRTGDSGGCARQARLSPHRDPAGDAERGRNPDAREGEGRLQLVLRNSSDEGIEKPPGRYVAELYGAPRKPAPP